MKAIRVAAPGVMLLACGKGGAATVPSVASHTRPPPPTTGPIDLEVVSFVKLMNAHPGAPPLD